MKIVDSPDQFRNPRSKCEAWKDWKDMKRLNVSKCVKDCQSTFMLGRKVSGPMLPPTLPLVSVQGQWRNRWGTVLNSSNPELAGYFQTPSGFPLGTNMNKWSNFANLKVTCPKLSQTYILALSQKSQRKVKHMEVKALSIPVPSACRSKSVDRCECVAWWHSQLLRGAEQNAARRCWAEGHGRHSKTPHSACWKRHTKHSVQTSQQTNPGPWCDRTCQGKSQALISTLDCKLVAG